MFPFIYVEKEVLEHFRVRKLLDRFSSAQKVLIERYGEVFNRSSQNFRLQKQKPSLIIARKRQNAVLEVPKGYGIGSQHNYYFSHLLNCPFDCRYCFLQGMYASAHFVFFVNFEDFQLEIEKKTCLSTAFFTGYDCDSLAMEQVTGFAQEFLPFIRNSSALFEFRTKSVQIEPFLSVEPISNCVISWTLSPETVQQEWEHRTPTLEKRLLAMEELQKKGWFLGLRFDPLIEFPDWKSVYQAFFKAIFNRLYPHAIHSVTLGSFRSPKAIFKKMSTLYPEEKLFARGLEEKNNLVRLKNQSLLSFCFETVIQYFPAEKVFICHD